MKRPRHRVFDYTPRFYKPEADVKEKKKKRLGFRSQLTRVRRNKKSPMLWVLLIILVIYIVLKLQGFA